jgi:transglutaminase-like putative cysteine protease
MDYGERYTSPFATTYAAGQRLPYWWRLGRAINGRYGWATLALIFVMSLCTPLAIQEIQWLDNVSILWPTALIAMIAGLVFSGRQGRRVVDVAIGVLLGCAGIFLVLGKILPSWRRIGENSEAIVAWLTQLVTGQAAPNPLPHIAVVTYDRVAGFVLQIVAWWKTGGSGQPEIDNRIFLFLLAIVVWSVTFYLAWALYRGINSMAAVMPMGVSLISFVVLGGQGSKYVVIFLVCTLLLLMRLHVQGLERRWNRRSVDYPSSVSMELFITGTIFTALIAVFSLLLPAEPQNSIAIKFWAFFNGPWSSLESNVGEAFTGVRHKVGGNAGTDLFLGGALGTTANTIVMYVQTDEPPPPDLPEEQLQAMGYSEPVHYFQGVAYVQYDGHAWGNTGKMKGRSHSGLAINPEGDPIVLGLAPAPSERQEDHLPTQPINPTIQGAEKIVQQVEKVEARSAIMYAYNVPVQIDEPYTVHQLGGAQTRIDLKGSAKKYTVISDVASPTAPQLRAASTNYPDWIGPYVAPPNVPGRVSDLARQWTANAADPYDKAIAIQDNLRKIPYTTDVLPVPGGRDAIDYFLFDTKQGYCEYYASAMVLMARAVGVPARVVSGYATTTYNRTKGAFEVDEADAHTWVQIYFPNVGWVDFEPTPVNPAITRPEGNAADADAVLPLPENPKNGLTPTRLPIIDRRIIIAGGVVLLALFLAYAIRRQWEAELTAEAMIAVVYGRLCRFSGWFGQPKLLHETPLEYGYRLAERFDRVAEPVAGHIRRIAVLFVMARYAGQPLGPEEKQEAKQAWKQVRPYLWQLRRGRRLVPAHEEPE